MKRILALVMAFLILALASGVNAISISDNFNDDSIDTAIWYNRSNIANATLTETNNRMEFFANNSCNGNPGYLCFDHTVYLQSISALGDADYGEFELTVQILDPPGTSSEFSVGFGDWVADVDALPGGAPIAFCGQYFEIASTGFRIVESYPSGVLVTNLGTIDAAEHTYRQEVRRTATTTEYYHYWDDALVLSDSQASACAAPILNVSMIHYAYSGSGEFEVAIDDYLFSSNVSSGAIDAGCDDDSDCDCGVCTAGFCDYISTGSYCTEDECCLSGLCTNNRCSRPGYVALISRGKDQFFGADEDTGNFVSLFFMIGIPVMIIAAGRNLFAVLGGGAVYFGLGLFFVMIGWLSPFIFVISFLVVMILMVIAFMVGLQG